MTKKSRTVTFTEPQVEMLLYELRASIRGDDDPYDNKLKRLIKKIEEAE